MALLDDLVKDAKPVETSAGPVLPTPDASTGATLDSILGAGASQPPPVVSAGAGTAITGEALMALLDGMTPMIVRLLCMKDGVHFTAELTRECRLTEAEKAQLRLTADAAAPLVAELLQKSKNIAVGIFAVSYVMIVGSKVAYIKSIAAPPPETPSEPEATDTATEVVDGGNPASQKRVYNRSGKYRGVAQARRKKSASSTDSNGVT